MIKINKTTVDMRGGIIEWTCEHGIGHYIPNGMHGCDGCCSKLTEKQRTKILNYKGKLKNKPWF